LTSNFKQLTFAIIKGAVIAPLILGNRGRSWWLMPVILATQEVEIRRIAVRSQIGQKNPGVDQGVGPEFKPQY
jgi:hypothetical protein